jgi:hypothetical protein
MSISISQLKAAHQQALAQFGEESPVTRQAWKALRTARRALRDERAAVVRAYEQRQGR